MKQSCFFPVLMFALIMALPIAAQTKQPDGRRVSALPVIEGDPDPTPGDRITIQMLKQKLDDGEKVLIIDSRSEDAWQGSEVKIKGAVHISLEQIEQEVKSGSLKAVPRTMLIAAYCACPTEATSGRVTQALMSHGFTNVKALIGGFDAWKQAGYPLEPKKISAANTHQQSKGKEAQRNR